MLPNKGVRVWVVYLTQKIERIIVLLSASPEGEARCRCRKVWLTRNDYYYFYYTEETVNRHGTWSENNQGLHACMQGLLSGTTTR
jgi:hypothetical protein